MSTTNHQLAIFSALAGPFGAGEVKQREGSKGLLLDYVTSRTVMNRLDDVIGPPNWWDRYEARENSVVCYLTVRLPDGQELTKSDAGGYAGMSDAGDDDKSGYADAFKRAAVKFGVGRYLYRDGVPSFAREAHETPRPGAEPRPEPVPSTGRNGAVKNGKHEPDRPPQGITVRLVPRPEPDAWDGRKLYEWVKRAQVVGWFNRYGADRSWPGRIIDWSPEHAAEAKAAFDEQRNGQGARR